MLFNDLKIINPILKALKDEGYDKATPIQEKAIPVILSGKDLVGCAQTGTGKTAAFALPILQGIFQVKNNNRDLKEKRNISGLILAPTRELAIQIGNNFKAYSCYMNIRVSTIYGGIPQEEQVKALEAGIDILVATPGRMLDLINQKLVNLKEVKYFVLDEADRMLDMGMIEDVNRIISYLPKGTQNLMFSATMPREIEDLVRKILRNPVRIDISPTASTAVNVVQGVYFVDEHNKIKLLLHLLNKNEAEQILVFTKTKHGANKIKNELLRNEINADALHGDRSQSAREKILKDFKEGTIKVLVATDVAARGIDIDNLKYVINFELPNLPETYVHRIGRTGRAGASGFAFSFCDIAEREMFHDIEKLIGKKITTVLENPYPAKNLVLEKKANKKVVSKEKNNKDKGEYKLGLPKKISQSGKPMVNSKKKKAFGGGNKKKVTSTKRK